jgi:hypothetical protein
LLVYGDLVRTGKSPEHGPVGWAFIATGVIGLGATIFSQVLYRGRCKAVRELRELPSA